MSLHISNFVQGPIAVTPFRQQTVAPQRQTFFKPHLNRSAFTMLVIAAILGLGIVLSINHDYLFLEELLVASAVMSMVLFLQTAQHPFQKPTPGAVEK